MQRDTTKRFYIIHSWVGILTAILIFVIAFTGAVSVFGRAELKIWSNKDIRALTQHSPEVIEQLVRQRASEVPEEYLNEILVLFPGVRSASTLVISFESHVESDSGKTEHHMIRFDHHPSTLELLERKEGTPREIFDGNRKDMADFIISFHADLHLGNPVGLLITGLLGLTLFASLVTGVITHRKILKEAFKFRPYRSFRLLFTDSHKALGVWGLLFHGVIAFTGAFLGLAVVLLLPAAAYVSFAGDTDKLVETFLPDETPEKSGTPSEIYIAEVLRQAAQYQEGKIVAATILAGTDSNAKVVVNTLAGREINGKILLFKASTAEKEGEYTTFSRIGGATGPLLDAMFPLHFGNFGGIAVKFLWFILGLSTALLAVTGAMIWIERRTFGTAGSLSITTYERISRLTSGACGGSVLAVASLFYAQLLLGELVLNIPGAVMGFWLGVVFFVTWFLAILWSALRENGYRIIKELVFASGLAYACIAPINGIITGDHLFNASQNGHLITAGVDVCTLVIGIVMMLTAVKLPSIRPERANKKSTSLENMPAPTLQSET